MMKITQPPDPTKEVPAKVIATSIEEMAKAMKILSSTRLNRRAIITLIHAESKVNKGDIALVLNNLEALEQLWLKPTKSSLLK